MNFHLTKYREYDTMSTVHYVLCHSIYLLSIWYNVFTIIGVTSATDLGGQSVSMHILNFRPKKPRMDFVEKSQDENIYMLLTFKMQASGKKKQDAPKRQ